MSRRDPLTQRLEKGRMGERGGDLFFFQKGSGWGEGTERFANFMPQKNQKKAKGWPHVFRN